MSLGVVMLVHSAFDRAEQLVRQWVAAECPVVVHVDAVVPKAEFDAFHTALKDLPQVKFARRYRCEWGTWGIVAGTQDACEILLKNYPDVHHVYLASGACVPLRPISELRRYLEARPQTDFIESATTADVPWIVDGLSKERFTLRFPFAWKSQRRAFDWYVKFQRRWRMKRRVPKGIVPHMGSQWWCLTRRTLTAILEAPNRSEVDRYFRRVWIPDESYFQTLTRNHSRNIESRSLTLSKFDYQGKPHIFYDDHLKLLQKSDCFVARKIWHKADKLWDAFLNPAENSVPIIEPNPARIDRIFAKAVIRRTQGRPGLYMQSRFPAQSHENVVTAWPYSVFEGFSELFVDFEPWLARHTGLKVHGHLFAPERAHFEGGQHSYAGALSDHPQLRDYNANAFLRNLIWNTRGQRQCFQWGARDCQDISWNISKDPNAQISVISGAWAIPLFQSNRDFADLRTEAARLQQIEADHLYALRSRWAKAKIHIWSLSEFMESPMDALQTIIDEISTLGTSVPASAPTMADLAGFGQFLQNLKDQGMHPYLMGDFPTDPFQNTATRPKRPKPYLVR